MPDISLPEHITVHFAIIDYEQHMTIYPLDAEDWRRFHNVTSVRYSCNPVPDAGDTPFRDIMKLRMALESVKERAEGVKARLELHGEPLAEATKFVGYIVNDINNALDICADARDSEKKARGGP